MAAKKIANYLKDEMKRQKLTNYELADRSGLSEPTIRQLKNRPGKTVKMDTCEQLAIGLGKSLREFLEESGVIDLLGLSKVSSADASIIINSLLPFEEKYDFSISELDRNDKLELVNYIFASIRLYCKNK